jgi:hypothetical protein
MGKSGHVVGAKGMQWTAECSRVQEPTGARQRNVHVVIAAMRRGSGDEGKSGGCPQTQRQLDRVTAVMARCWGAA